MHNTAKQSVDLSQEAAQHGKASASQRRTGLLCSRPLAVRCSGSMASRGVPIQQQQWRPVGLFPRRRRHRDGGAHLLASQLQLFVCCQASCCCSVHDACAERLTRCSQMSSSLSPPAMFLGTAQSEIYVSSNGADAAMLAVAHVSGHARRCCCPGYVSLPWRCFPARVCIAAAAQQRASDCTATAHVCD
jgi:hypothetical protein